MSRPLAALLAALFLAPLALPAPGGAAARSPAVDRSAAAHGRREPNARHRGAAPPAALSALDLIALEICYTTVLARYYEPVDPAALLGGARTGIVAYLAGRGIPNPAIPLAPAHADRWRAENAIDRDVALAVARYGRRVRPDELVADTIAGELAVLHDPYSVLFRPRAYKRFVGFLDGTATGGIGAELDVDPQSHDVRVVDVFPGSPAEAAGILPGDRIAAIDGNAPATGVPGAVQAALRGRPGTTVRLTIVRDGATLAPLALVRRAIVPADATGRLLPDGIGYVRLRSFGAESAAQVSAVLAKLAAASPRGYVLDLRANGGGYRDAAVAVASHFVRGTVVTTRERGAPPRAFAADPSTPRIAAPLAVLIDGDTASAAEILAGAIQDDHAGTLVGARTFGKGLVQETFALPDGGAIKLTTAVYRTPAGRDIEHVGISPDVPVAEPAGSHVGEPGHDPQLDRALALLSGSATPAPAR
ncbi:MAG TPA: S41 family peptidase [Candidatus Baltobacteraceae bacterium]|nr:S41 family peptidase [Candidatus Baltobacteraceae bacterium]